MRLVSILGMAGVVMITPTTQASATQAQAAEESTEALARERNYGFAEYENEEYPKAAEHF